ncbi:MAG: hypothetical protein ABW321_08225 [Polyangiales bacterium]
MRRVSYRNDLWAPVLAALMAGGCSSNDAPADTGDTNNPSSGAPAGAGAPSGAAGARSGAAGGGATSGTPTPSGGVSGGLASGAAGGGGVVAGGVAGANAGAAGGGGVSAGAGAAGVGAAAGSGGSDSAAAGGGGTGGSAGGAGEDAAGGAGGSSAAARPPAKSLMLPIMMESGGVEPWFNIYRPTDLSATSQPLPVIVWANGGCFRSDFTWEPLFNRWAAGGFIVLALTESPTEGALVQTSIEDQGKLIDWAFEQADKEGGTYAGKLDKTKLVAAGNSCGGVTALGLTAEDERVAAVFVLSGSSNVGAANTQVTGAIKVPVGYVVGGPEDIAGANATGDYDSFSADLPAMIVSRKSGDHQTVSTDTMILPQVAEIALNWMDLALYGTKDAADELNTPNVCASCTPGDWTLKSKNLETLVK